MPVMNDYEATVAIMSLPDAWEKQTGNRVITEFNEIIEVIKNVIWFRSKKR